MSMQRLSVEQVAILTILYELEGEIGYDIETLEEETNGDRFDKIKPDIGWDDKEIDDITEELQYWGYIDKDCNLTVPGRQYLKTGPDCTDSSIGSVTTKNYNITLFEKIADIKGINVDFAAKASIFDSISSVFNWASK